LTASEDLNRQLRAFYTSHWAAIQQCVPVSGGYSKPHLLRVNPGYIHAPTKLLIVGQQTHGWDFTPGIDYPSNQIDALMNLYHEFNLGERYRSTPFWRTAYHLQAKVNPAYDQYGFLWSNLIRVDHDGNRATEVEDILCRIPLLAGEIKILQPDAVVFLTGPSYEDRLLTTFPGIQKSRLKAFDPSVLARIVGCEMPKSTFRTYHAKFIAVHKSTIQIADQLDRVVDTIAMLINADRRKH
jgi:hypothetical protein